MKRILITGNEGYIGSVLVETLIQKGYEVTGLDFGIFQDVTFVPRKIRAHWQIYKDVRDVTVDDVKGFDAIIHLAALSNDPIGYLKPEITYEINHLASVNLARCAKEAGVERFLFSSSCSMYGISKQQYVTEEAEFNPQTPYAESKVRTEYDLRALADKQFCPVYLRNATVFGVSPRMRLDLVVQNLTAYGYLNGVITILSDGTPWRPLIHVKDISEAFCLLLEAPKEKVCNQAFNVGHKDNNIQIKNIAEQVKQVIPNTKIRVRNENPDDNRSYKVDFSKIYTFGFLPRYTIMDGIKEIYEIFRKIHFSADVFQTDKYITLKRYQKLIAEDKMNEHLRLMG